MHLHVPTNQTKQRREFRAEVSESLEASLSSHELVHRPFGDEELLHTPDAVNLARAADNGLPLLWGHDDAQPIGRVRNISIVDGQLRGQLEFSPHSELARTREAEARDGFLDGVSIGYRIDEVQTREGSDVVQVSKWTPLEVSLVSVAADPSVGIGRKEETVMEVVNDGAQIENQRQKEIRQMFSPYLQRGPKYAALQEEVLGQVATTREMAAVRVLELVGAESGPLGSGPVQGANGGFTTEGEQRAVRIDGGREAGQKFHEAAVKAICHRSALEKDEDIGANPLGGYTLREIARESLKMRGETRSFSDPSEMIGEAFFATRAGPAILSHGTGDFGGILLDAANKGAMRGWDEADESWRTIARVTSTPDFRAFHRTNLSTITDLPVVEENAQIPMLDASDVRETATPAKYAGRIGITREAILNDDLSQLSRLPMRLGRAAARVPGDLVYGVITANAVLLQDATALFDAATHGNLETTGGAPTNARIDAGRLAMATQTDPQGNTLGIRPAYIIVPEALRTTAQVQASSQYDPDATAGVFKPNTALGLVNVVADYRLDDDSAVKWYMSANPQVEDTLEIAFVSGRDTPVLETEQAWTRYGTEWRCRIECVALALDYRGLYQNDGA